MVLGEGAAVLVLEELEHAQSRNARIYAEVVGHAARHASDAAGVGIRRRAVGLAMRRALDMAGAAANSLGHVHAHGLSTVTGDREEAAAMGDALGTAAGSVPLVAAKSHFGNLGAGSGVVECIASVLALRQGTLFPLLNHESADPECPIRPARSGDPAGESFISSAVTPQGQAGTVVIRSWGSVA
jgi:3-oxoacyl-[acyl-carrier-protein] synthase II